MVFLKECLLDLLVQPEGPRLRDRISHGEVHMCVVSHLYGGKPSMEHFCEVNWESLFMIL
jgi:hypothetical protein